ncbi:MAG: hypothetical protein IPO24_11760 [Bacteroidetes bacterium]|nr:hypothetical protein [Bacteroidota bacterium]
MQAQLQLTQLLLIFATSYDFSADGCYDIAAWTSVDGDGAMETTITMKQFVTSVLLQEPVQYIFIQIQLVENLGFQQQIQQQ